MIGLDNRILVRSVARLPRPRLTARALRCEGA